MLENRFFQKTARFEGHLRYKEMLSSGEDVNEATSNMKLKLIVVAILAFGCGPPADRWQDFEGKRLFMRRADMDSLVDKEGMTVECVGKAAEMAIDPNSPCLKKDQRYSRKQRDSLVTREGMTRECVEQANKTGFNADFVCDKRMNREFGEDGETTRTVFLTPLSPNSL